MPRAAPFLAGRVARHARRGLHHSGSQPRRSTGSQRHAKVPAPAHQAHRGSFSRHRSRFRILVPRAHHRLTVVPARAVLARRGSRSRHCSRSHITQQLRTPPPIPAPCAAAPVRRTAPRRLHSRCRMLPREECLPLIRARQEDHLAHHVLLDRRHSPSRTSPCAWHRRLAEVPAPAAPVPLASRGHRHSFSRHVGLTATSRLIRAPSAVPLAHHARHSHRHSCGLGKQQPGRPPPGPAPLIPGLVPPTPRAHHRSRSRAEPCFRTRRTAKAPRLAAPVHCTTRSRLHSRCRMPLPKARRPFVKGHSLAHRDHRACRCRLCSSSCLRRNVAGRSLIPGHRTGHHLRWSPGRRRLLSRATRQPGSRQRSEALQLAQPVRNTFSSR